MEVDDSSPNTKTSPCNPGVVGVGMFTNGDCRFSMLGVGEGGVLPRLDTDSDLASEVGLSSSSALCTKWHLGP